MQLAHIESKESTKKICDFFPQHNFQARDSDDHISAHNGNSPHSVWLAVAVIWHSIHSAAI